MDSSCFRWSPQHEEIFQADGEVIELINSYRNYPYFTAVHGVILLTILSLSQTNKLHSNITYIMLGLGFPKIKKTIGT